MKVIKIAAFGGPEQLVVAEMPAVSAGPGQVVIAVEASGVGLLDTFVRRGLYPGMPAPGGVPGGEVAGTVVARGEGVAASWLGRRVYALLRIGGDAEQVAVAISDLAPLPEALSAADAVALGINALVAKFALEQAHLQAGERVLVRGAGGGIGVMATQLALLNGALVTAVTSTADRMEQLRALGAVQVLDRAVAVAAPGELDVVIDIVAGAEVSAFLARMAPNGRYVLVGIAGGLPPTDFGMGLIQNTSKSLALSFLSLDSFPASRITAALSTLFDLVASHRLTPIIDQTYPLAQAAAAHTQLESGKVFGKLVLTS